LTEKLKGWLGNLFPGMANLSTSLNLSGSFQTNEPKLVVVGGGTGLSTLLRGLKSFSSNITAIVTVGDDGGSSGRLRQELGVLPPGDIRNCLVALAGSEALLTDLFSYRFDQGEGLAGHSFGNLFLAALTDLMQGDFLQAIQVCSEVLSVRGKVLPATLQQVVLVAEYIDGEVIRGESRIGRTPRHIVKLSIDPDDAQALPQAISAILEADAVILGPGSLYTSIIPNLMVKGIVEAIQKSPAVCIYVCNIMTQPGETSGHTAADHLQAILGHAKAHLVDVMLVNQGNIDMQAMSRYQAEGGSPVIIDEEKITESGVRLLKADLVHSDNVVRHDSLALARMVIEVTIKERYTLQRRRALLRQLRSMS